jgi:hypothetical protein
VIVKSSLNYNNTGNSLSSVQIDFANGQGFVNIPLNVAVTAAYTDTGYYRWTIKATLSNSTVLQCYADYYVVHIPSVSNITPFSYEPSGVNGPRIAGTGSPNVWGNIDAEPGVHSGGTIYIVYGNKDRTNTLRKPLIVVENMDAFNLAPQVQSRPYTVTDFIRLLDGTLPEFNFNFQLDDVAGYDLVFINFNDGMDGIVRNAAVVQEAINRINSNKVADDRNNNVIQQNVVMGIGTGGLNARYALANMAKNFSGSNTRLLITHDAPHRGQNIAVGLQYLVKFIKKSTAYSYNIGQVFPEHGQTMEYFKSKVCKDVLIYQTSDIDNSVVQNSFIENVYQPMVTFAANTQPYQFVATSLGNECAAPLFEAGRRFMDFGSQTAVGLKIKVSLGLLIGGTHRLDLNLFSIPISELKYETVVFARAIPNQNNPQRLITAYTHISKFTLLGGLVNISKNGVDEVAVAGTNLLPIDGVPGSFHTLLDFTELRRFQNSFGTSGFSYDEYIATLFKIPVKWFLAIKFSLYGFFKSSMYNSGIFNTNYTSLPVGSSLDVSPFNSNTFTQKYVNGVNQNYPSKSNTFIAQETVTSQGLYNNSSMRFTARNARFMFNEMEELPNIENCSAECSNPYYIEGNPLLCESRSYFIPGLPRGATVSWAVAPSGIVIPPPNGNPITLNKLTDGVITLTATISNACGGSIVIQGPNITVGTPKFTVGGVDAFNITGSMFDYSPNGPGNSLSVCPNESLIFTPYFPNTFNQSFITGHEWTVSGVAGGNLNTGALSVTAPFTHPSAFTFTYRYQNGCGFSAYANGTASTRDCAIGEEPFRGTERLMANTSMELTTQLAIFPNPAHTNLFIHIPSDSMDLVKAKITITDISGRTVKQVASVSQTNTIRVSAWPNGTYIVMVTDGNKKLVRKIVKN